MRTTGFLSRKPGWHWLGCIEGMLPPHVIGEGEVSIRMPSEDSLQMDQKRLVEAWARMLPETMDKGDRVEVRADEADPKAVRIYIEAAGHSMYTFDFKCTYVDSREVKVELVDAERADQTIDERGQPVQDLIQDYVRHIHECAQALQQLTYS